MSLSRSLLACQYKLGELELSGYKVFPVEKLRELIHLQPGQPANAVEAGEDVEAHQAALRLSRLHGRPDPGRLPK